MLLTKSMVDKILVASKKVTDEFEKRWDDYQWGDGDYPYYTGYSCEAEIAAIIASVNN